MLSNEHFQSANRSFRAKFQLRGLHRMLTIFRFLSIEPMEGYTYLRKKGRSSFPKSTDKLRVLNKLPTDKTF